MGIFAAASVNQDKNRPRHQKGIYKMNTDYKLLIQQAEALVQGVPHLTANLANISALLYTSLEDINWAGFYLTEGSQHAGPRSLPRQPGMR